ncbi:MAG: ABC transporter ATP-binding protein [Gammaproteobacteria bacterium]|nr:ABC transporter ATP-binding protein [Gammaproteobacteria bacterium]
MMMLRAENLHCLRDGKPVLKGLGFELAAGEVLGVLGPNGAGKSSLLLTLAGLLPLSSGALRLGDTDSFTLTPLARARRVGYLPQQPMLAWPLSVRELVGQGRFPHPADPEADTNAVDAALLRTELTTLAERDVATLSGGERARAHLARLLAGRHELLLCDEPVAALEPFHQLAFLALLQSLAREGGSSIIVVLHDLALAARWCDRVLVLAEGRAVASGAPDLVLDDELLASVFRVCGTRDANSRLLGLAPLNRQDRLRIAGE